MKTFLDDVMINKKILTRLKKSILIDQLEEAIDKLDNFNNIQMNFLAQCDASRLNVNNSARLKRSKYDVSL